MRRHVPVLFLNTLLAMICVMGIVASAWASEVIMGAGAAATENIFRKIEYPMRRALDIKLTNIPSGPVQAWKDLDAGKVHCAAGGVALADWLELMKKDGYAIPDPSVYKSWIIGQDKIKVMINPGIPVKSLSKEQLTGIFTGTIKNWSQVDGPDKPILVVLGSEIPGTMSVFQRIIMGGAAFTKDAMMGTTVEDIKDRIIRNDGAIGFGALSQVDYLINAPNIPEISRPITLITKGEPTADVLKMIEYINKDGQRYIIK